MSKDKKTLRNYLILLGIVGIAAISAISVSKKAQIKVVEKINERMEYTPAKTWVGEYLSGYHATKTNDYSKASDYFSESLRLKNSGEFLEAHTLGLLLVAGKVDEARKIAEQLYSKSKNNLAALTLIAGAAMDDNYDEAEKVLAKYQEDKSTSIINGIINAWVKLGNKKPEEAKKIISGLQNDPLFEVFTKYNYALISELSGDNAKAESLYDELLTVKKLPLNIQAAAWNFYGKIGKKDKQAAIDASQKSGYDLEKHYKITSAKEGIAESLVGVGGIIMNEYSQDKAASIFRLSLYLNPKLDQARLLLGTVLMNEGDFSAANKILSSIPNDSYLGDLAKLTIAKNFESMDKNDKAKEFLSELISNKDVKFDTMLDALVTMADLGRKTEKYDEANDYYTKALNLVKTKYPNQEYDTKYWAIFFARGVCLERLKEWDKAESDFNFALKLYPNQPDVLNYLGYSWIEMDKNLGQAKDMVLKALEQKPDDAHIIDSAGWAWFKLGDYTKAVNLLEEAAGTMPYDPTVNDHLGDAYWKIGRKNEAKFQWNRALKNDPDKELKAKLISKIDHGLSVSEGNNEQSSASAR